MPGMPGCLAGPALPRRANLAGKGSRGEKYTFGGHMPDVGYAGTAWQAGPGRDTGPTCVQKRSTFESVWFIFEPILGARPESPSRSLSGCSSEASR